MKAFSVAILLVLVLSRATIFSQTQTKEKELSNAEQFSAKAGTLMQKEFIDIGTIKGAKIQAMLLKDLITNSKSAAIRFEYESGGRYTSTKIAVLDADEVDALLKSIRMLQTTVLTQAMPNYTEVSFRSRGGFEAGCYFSDGKWSAYIKLEKYDKDSYVFLNSEDFGVLAGLLTDAKAKL